MGSGDFCTDDQHEDAHLESLVSATMRRAFLKLLFAAMGLGAFGTGAGQLGFETLARYLFTGGGAIAGALALVFLIKYSFELMLGLRDHPFGAPKRRR